MMRYHCRSGYRLRPPELVGDGLPPPIEQLPKIGAMVGIGERRLKRQVIGRTTAHRALCVKLPRKVSKDAEDGVLSISRGSHRLQPRFLNGCRYAFCDDRQP
jgi:hypothetical protein